MGRFRSRIVKKRSTIYQFSDFELRTQDIYQLRLFAIQERRPFWDEYFRMLAIRYAYTAFQYVKYIRRRRDAKVPRLHTVSH